MSDKHPDNILRFPGLRRTLEPAASPADAFLEAMRTIAEEPEKPKRPRKKAKAAPAQTIEGDSNTQIGGAKKVSQSIRGSGNTQIAGGVQSLTIKAGKTPKVELAPPPGSIGASPALRSRIEALIKEINEYRYVRLGKAFKGGAIYGELARAFGLKGTEWRSIWLWDEARAGEVINWLAGKRDNTQQGRINKAAKGEGYQHSRGHLFRLEKDYLGQLEWSDDVIRKRRQLVAGHASRADLSDGEFRNWVAYLRRELEEMYGETEN